MKPARVERGDKMSVKSVIQTNINNSLRPLGVQLVKGYSADPAIRT